MNGDPDKRAEIVSTGSGLEARNEKGEASRVSVESNGDIRALDWEGGYEATLIAIELTGRIAPLGHARPLDVSPRSRQGSIECRCEIAIPALNRKPGFDIP
jgi:hypothetical protein